jgi:hypothetical protein
MKLLIQNLLIIVIVVICDWEMVEIELKDRVKMSKLYFYGFDSKYKVLDNINSHFSKIALTFLFLSELVNNLLLVPVIKWINEIILINYTG